MTKTGDKYTAARREQELRESLLPDDATRRPIVEFAREKCNDCEGPVRWVIGAELEQVRPAAYAELVQVFGSEAAQLSAWVCLECDTFGLFGATNVFGDEFGLFSGEEADNFETLHGSGHVNWCSQCGNQLEWVDPARIATIDRDCYLAAKRKYGATATLEGSAGICGSCSHIEIHPDPAMLSE